jgi:iron complex outermembrane recepter protein
MNNGLTRLMPQCVLGCILAALSFAAVPPDAPSGNPLSVDIPEQPLSMALAAFAVQTGLRLAYISAIGEDRVSRKARAGMPPSAALRTLLSGTGLDFIFLNSRTIKIFEIPKVAAADAAALEEIVVTATKREESLSKVPISATVYSAEAIDVSGIKGIAELAALTPGVEYDSNAHWGAGVLTNLAIRGIDSRVGASTTGVYIDDAPIQARNGNFGNPYPVTFDLARIEVLRGPQSTLFGAGAEGGAIRFITNEPSTTSYSGLFRSELSATEYGGLSYEAGAIMGAPIVEGRLGIRFSAWYRDDGGYIDRISPFTGAIVDKNANESTTKAFRLSFAVEPDSLRITPSIAYQSAQIGDSPNYYVYLSDPGAGVLRSGKLLSQPAVDAFTFSSLKVEARLGTLELTAVTSYFDRTETATIDSTNQAGTQFGGYGNPLGLAYPTSYADAAPSVTALHQIVASTEVRVNSANEEALLKWTAGAFFSRALQDERLDSYYLAAPANPGILSNDQSTDILLAGFGNLDLALSQRVRATLGIRVDHTRSEFSDYTAGFVFAGSGVPPFARGATNATPVTPQFNLVYDAGEHSMVYATVARGFRIGGANVGLPAFCGPFAAPPSYASDSVWSYELGTKNNLFDDRLQIAASTFYLRWNDIQNHEVLQCGAGFVANAGDAIGKGFDLTANALLTDRIKVGLALGAVDVRYTETVVDGGYVIAERGAVVGGVPHVPPPWNGTLYIRYQWPLAHGTAYARAEEIATSHNPGPFTESNPKALGDSPSYQSDPATNRLNLQLGLSWTRWDIKLFANNVLNSLPALQRNVDASGSTLVYAYTFRPRTLGLTANWTF